MFFHNNLTTGAGLSIKRFFSCTRYFTLRIKITNIRLHRNVFLGKKVSSIVQNTTNKTKRPQGDWGRPSFQ